MSDVVLDGREKSGGVFWNVIVVLFILSVGGAFVYLELQKRELLVANDVLEKRFFGVRDEVKVLGESGDNKKISVLSQSLKKVEDYRIAWSEIALDIMAQEGAWMKFDSFSSGREQSVSVKGKTTDWGSVIHLIGKLRANPNFENPFVHSVSEQLSKDNFRYQFNLTFDYKNDG